MNPFVLLINMLSDGPKLSKSCFCADDVGSVFKALKTLKIHHSIFRIASRVSRMELKPAKCYLVVTRCNLSVHLKHAIRAWLTDNIPEWKDFQIVAAGKYLRVYIGVDGARITYRDPTHKYLDRVEGIAGSAAPTLGCVLQYNARVVTVFSYVSQIVQIPSTKEFAALEQRGVHKMLKLPPNSMSHKFMHGLEPFLPKSPTALLPMCRATLARFAHSNQEFLRQLLDECLATIGEDRTPLADLNTCRIPDAGLGHPAFLNIMIDALERKREYNTLPPQVRDQSSIYKCLLSNTCCNQRVIVNKIHKTFADIGTDLHSLVFPASWLGGLEQCFRQVKQQAAFALLRTFISGWTTSHRMHEDVLLPCIFGCRNETDTIAHYMLCSPLCHIAGAALSCEVPIDFATRACISNVCPQHVNLLACACHTYHYTTSKRARRFCCCRTAQRPQHRL